MVDLCAWRLSSAHTKLYLIFMHRFRLLPRPKLRHVRSVHTLDPLVCFAVLLDFCTQVSPLASTQHLASKVCAYFRSVGMLCCFAWFLFTGVASGLDASFGRQGLSVHTLDALVCCAFLLDFCAQVSLSPLASTPPWASNLCVRFDTPAPTIQVLLNLVSTYPHFSDVCQCLTTQCNMFDQINTKTSQVYTLHQPKHVQYLRLSE